LTENIYKKGAAIKIPPSATQTPPFTVTTLLFATKTPLYLKQLADRELYLYRSTLSLIDLAVSNQMMI
jgi:hypothetical protein